MSTVSFSGGATAPKPILFETVAEEVFRRYGRTWKPATLSLVQRQMSMDGERVSNEK